TVFGPKDIADLAFWPVSGYIRYYEMVKPEEDCENFVQKTLDISLPGKISLAVNSFMNQVPLGYYAEIQKGSTFISFNHKSFQELSAFMPEVKDLALKIVAAGEQDWHLKMEMCKVKCAEGYEKFLDYFGSNVTDFVEQQHIASYLGMAPEELSRIRKIRKS
ncbi:MAG TPA: hypothetical protein VKB19_01140, partial [Pedobacter sp.]|nr:hypothetical protein [Pedobacter sp.]